MSSIIGRFDKIVDKLAKARSEFLKLRTEAWANESYWTGMNSLDMILTDLNNLRNHYSEFYEKMNKAMEQLEGAKEE